MAQDRVRDSALWKMVIIPTTITAIISIIALSLINGQPGAFGAILASITVLIFFTIHLMVARVSNNLDPMATMALALLSYFIRLFLWEYSYS